ncbi:MAG: hypothetical protein ACJKTH_00480 [Patescibacteria group bacterium UBA2163]
MNNSNNHIKRKVMMRVYGVYMLRQVTRLEVRVAALMVLIGAVLFSVSLSDIFANAISTMTSFDRFFSYAADALLSTEVAVQLAMLAVAVITLWLMRDVWYWLAQSSFFAHREHV